jgi:glycosyltransferase involved in cell wall biosynthesis
LNSNLNNLISVIIPAHNSKNTIYDSINSVLNQTYKNFEIIIIDNGSTDNLYEYLKNTFDNNIHIRYYFIEIANASKARNFGISKAVGDYIQFLDSDDVISKDKFQNQITLLEKYNASLVFCNTYKFKDFCSIQSGDCYRIDDISSDIIELPIKNFLDFLFVKDGIKMIAVHAFLAKRSLILSTGKWNEEISLDDDGEYFFRVYLKIDKIIYDSNSISYYRISHSNSLSNTSLTKGIRSEFLSIESKKKQLLNSITVLETLKKQIVRNLQSAYLYKYIDFRDYKEFQTIYDDLFNNFSGFNNSMWPRKITRLISSFISFNSIVMLKLKLAQFKKLVI